MLMGLVSIDLEEMAVGAELGKVDRMVGGGVSQSRLDYCARKKRIEPSSVRRQVIQ